MPLLIMSASKDGVNPPNQSKLLYERALEPKSLEVIEGATHYDLYKGEYFEKAITKQIAWFEKYLK